LRVMSMVVINRHEIKGIGKWNLEIGGVLVVRDDCPGRVNTKPHANIIIEQYVS